MNAYDRPIARRIIESANVPGGTFANRKKLTAKLANHFYWPHSKKAIADITVSKPAIVLLAGFGIIGLAGYGPTNFAGNNVSKFLKEKAGPKSALPFLCERYLPRWLYDLAPRRKQFILGFF